MITEVTFPVIGVGLKSLLFQYIIINSKTELAEVKNANNKSYCFAV